MRFDDAGEQVIPVGLEVDRSEASRAVFFEEDAENFLFAVTNLSGERATAESKVFWFFFSKKDCLLSSSQHPGRLM